MVLKDNKIPYIVMVLVVEKNENIRVSTGWIFLPVFKGLRRRTMDMWWAEFVNGILICFSMSVFAHVISLDLGIVPGI